MKNLKVSMKLIVSFVIVIGFAVAVGVAGMVGMARINAADKRLYDMNLLAIEQMGVMQSSLNEERVQVRNLIIYDAEDPTFQNALTRLEEEEAKFQNALALYEPTITDPADWENIQIIKDRHEQFIMHLEELKIMGAQNRNTQAQLIMDSFLVKLALEINAAFEANNALNSAAAKASVEANARLFETMAVIEIAVLAAAVFVSLFLAIYISGLISRPLRDMMGYIKQAGETGNLVFKDEDWRNCERLSKAKDEIGQTMKAFTRMMHKLAYYGEAVRAVANKDLTISVETLGGEDTFGNAIGLMAGNLSGMFLEINDTAVQVSDSSVQIADGAQHLAEGSTEQSATVEELSASVTEISERTKANARLADDAKRLGEDIKATAERGNAQMGHMIRAVDEISNAGTAIGKVIKIIDDIAFQTNILALNASVEAARAGIHGKGFAVVADEVRSLAAKSAEAAKNTSELIEASIKKSQQGAEISKGTAESLGQIVAGILQSSELVAQIAQSSNEQSLAIAQISEAIDQVSQGIQQNSATAQESAAASHEMSGRATALQRLVSQFKLNSQAGDMPMEPENEEE
jgi:methyl-accepting chemotaxis protein